MFSSAVLFAVYEMDLMYAKWTYNTIIIRSLSLFDATFIGLFLSPEAGFWTEEEQTQISEFCGMMDARHGPGQDLYRTVRSKIKQQTASQFVSLNK